MLERIASAERYDDLEKNLVAQGFAIDTVYFEPAFGHYATDRIYSFQVGPIFGTLLLEFTADTILRRQIFFCNPDAWLLPVPDSAKSSPGTRDTYLKLAEILDRGFGSSREVLLGTSCRIWSNGVQLSFDSDNAFVVLTLTPAVERPSMPWMVKPSGMPSFSRPTVLRYGSPHVTRIDLSNFKEYLYGPDTLLGVPGVAHTILDSNGVLRLHLWNSIIGISTNVLDSFSVIYENSLGKPVERQRNRLTWKHDTSLFRLARIDSVTFYSIFHAKSSRSDEYSDLTILQNPELILTQLARCTEFEEAASVFDRQPFTRKGIFIFDRTITPMLKHCKTLGEARPSSLRLLWED